MPTASLWSWATKNPVLSLVINKGLPAAVGLALGLFTWRRRSAKDAPQAAGAEPQKASPKAAKRKSLGSRLRSKRLKARR